MSERRASGARLTSRAPLAGLPGEDFHYRRNATDYRRVLTTILLVGSEPAAVEASFRVTLTANATEK